MNNKKIASRKRISAIFLAIVLVAGTITALSSSSTSSFMVGVEAQTYYEGDGGGMDNRYNSYEPTVKDYENDNSYDNKKSYETNSYEPTVKDYENDNSYDNKKSYETNSYEPTVKDYGMDDNSYQKTYGKDNDYDQSQYQSYGKDNRDKSKDSSKSISLNKLNCINTNLNINGNNSGNVSIGNKGAAEEGGYSDAYSSGGSGGYGSEGYGKQGKGIECIINNNNTNTNIVTVGGGNVTNGGGNQTDACEECFNANATLAGIITAKLALGGAIPITGFPSLSIPADVTTIAGLCDFLESAIPGAITQDGAELTLVINSILATGTPPPPPVSQASITALINCLLEVDFG